MLFGAMERKSCDILNKFTFNRFRSRQVIENVTKSGLNLEDADNMIKT